MRKNQPNRFLLSVSFLLVVCVAFTQTNSLCGKVVNYDSLDLKGGRVVIYDISNKYINDIRLDSNSNFCMANLTNGYYYLYIKHPAYNDSEVRFIEVNRDIMDLLILMRNKKKTLHIDKIKM